MKSCIFKKLNNVYENDQHKCAMGPFCENLFEQQLDQNSRKSCD